VGRPEEASPVPCTSKGKYEDQGNARYAEIVGAYMEMNTYEGRKMPLMVAVQLSAQSGIDDGVLQWGPLSLHKYGVCLLHTFK
jgi:hypothetical protein